ncbi:MAG: Eco57I restriction-modification methylase domain-containing protein [Fenollaria timonensis]
MQERCNWIFKNQLYGIAITELTSLLSRRSVYCSKYANSPFPITPFDDVQGNILFHEIKHTWDKNDKKGHCIYCGISFNNSLNDISREGMESHAYEFIHTLHPEEIFEMKFEIILSFLHQHCWRNSRNRLF